MAVDYATSEVKPEVTGFGKGRRKGRTPAPSKFHALNTIDEAINETMTSIKDDDSRVGSNNLRSSHPIYDLEEFGNTSQHRDSLHRVDLLNRSLNGPLDQVIRAENQEGRSSTDPLQTEEQESSEGTKSDK